MEAYCLRVTHPDYEGWWVVNPAEHKDCIEVGFGYGIAQRGAGISAWTEPKLSEIQSDLLADGYETTRIPLEAAQQYMSS
jgi:hypothetical protein